MSNIHASPGVYFETLDFSTYVKSLSKTNVGIAGKAVKGPTEPTFISSVRQYIDTFGAPRRGDYSALAAVSYLENGSALWYSRIVGKNARKAYVDIPKARMIENELIDEISVSSPTRLIYHKTLNHHPIPGTVEVKIVSNSDPSNFIIIRDNNIGKFVSESNTSVADIPNYIDYNTGDYYFTVNGVCPNLTLEYNAVKYTSKDELIYTVPVSILPTISGFLKFSQLSEDIADIPEFTIRNSSNSVVDVLVVNSYNSTTNELEFYLSSDSAKTIIAKINTKNGRWEITTSTVGLTANSKIYVTYKYSYKKNKAITPISSSISGSSFVGSVNCPIDLNTFKVINGLNVIAKDNGKGEILSVGGATPQLMTSSNSINTLTKEFELALKTPILNDSKIYISYPSKFSEELYKNTGTAPFTPTGTQVFNITETPIAKNSVTITIAGNACVLTDDGNGNLVSNNGQANGSIDYETGVCNLNHTLTLAIADIIEIQYLSKLGTATARYFGNSYNNTRVEFYKDKFTGYGVRVWNSNQSVDSVPEENWNGLNVTDSNSIDFYLNKVNSRHLEFNIPDYLGTSNIPIVGIPLILTGGHDDENGINSVQACTTLKQFSNSEALDINILICPDFPGDKIVISEMINICENVRGDCFTITDPSKGLSPQEVVDWHNGDGRWLSENALNSTFAALYYPWVQIVNQFTESFEWVPPSVKIISVYAYNDRVSETWNAPAGLNRGKLFKVVKLERQLDVNDRDLLYATGNNAINPIVDFSGDGIVVYGQKTLQRKPSATDRVNVSRLLIEVAKILATGAKYVVFDPNDRLTWTLYTQMINPYLNSVKLRRGLYEYSIVCDETTNTPADIDGNTMIAEIWIKPTKTAERLINRFIITSSGASFSDLKSELSKSN